MTIFCFKRSGTVVASDDDVGNIVVERNSTSPHLHKPSNNAKDDKEHSIVEF